MQTRDMKVGDMQPYADKRYEGRRYAAKCRQEI
jgi:hypothetical protein